MWEAGLARVNEEERQQEATLSLLAAERLVITNGIDLLSDLLGKDGIAALDAVHLAMASCAGADFFVTCDDKLLRKRRISSHQKCQVAPFLGIIAEILK